MTKTSALNLLTNIVPSINNTHAAHACFTVLTDPRFLNSYASSIGNPHAHHAYPGGLLIHTAEVLELALSGTAYPEIITLDPQILIPAIIFHDYGKIYDYDFKGVKTSHYDLIKHVSASYHLWCMLMDGCEDLTLVDNVSHCILSHHGRPEWGSPVEPKTAEALALHQADMLSSKFGVSR